jgi:glycosyltransferase involved in cell wall biosynthesis
VGRINPEKGINNFISLFNEMNTDSELFIAGNSERLKVTDHKIKSLGYISSEQELIRTYDLCNITILPSYTEAHPYVLEESLSRKRPVIIFEDIAYVKKNKKGVYITKRDFHEVTKQIEWILKNYQSIQKEMDQNDLPTMQKMIDQFSNILQ